MVNYFFTLAHFCETHGPVPLLSTRLHKNIITADLNTSHDACASCKLVLPNNDYPTRYLASQCDDTGMEFISSKYFNNPIINEKFKAIVVRSLSEEANSKICFFGDSNLMYSISRCFTLRDSLARGKTRKYSIIITSDNQNLLLRNSNKITSLFHYLIKFIKKKRLENPQESNYTAHKSHVGGSNSNSNSNSNTNNTNINSNNYVIPLQPQRTNASSSSHHSKSSRKPKKPTAGLEHSSSDSDDNISIDYTALIRNQSIVLRNLSDILNDRQVYLKIHLIALNFLRDLYLNS